MAKSKEVEAWFARYENPMKPVVERIRAIVLAADARMQECIKWQAPTFAYEGNLASFFPKSKQHARARYRALYESGAVCILGNHDEFMLRPEVVASHTTLAPARALQRRPGR